MQRFSGFGERASDFYEGLEADNSKAYWTDHKDVYEEHIRAPMLALLAELEDEFGAGKVFRPHRDVRFSHDKSPYKTHCGAVVWTQGGSYYVHVAADGLLVAGGAHGMTAEQVARFREAVSDQRRGADLQRRLEELRHRTLYAWRSWPPDDALHTPACSDRVRTAWHTLRPLNEWLADHVGAADPC